jgi:hypothetical protein
MPGCPPARAPSRTASAPPHEPGPFLLRWWLARPRLPVGEIHSITSSSARANRRGGKASPITLAAFALITSRKLVVNSTGRSAGFATLEDLVYDCSDLLVHDTEIRRIRHQPSGLRVRRIRARRRNFASQVLTSRELHSVPVTSAGRGTHTASAPPTPLSRLSNWV